MTKSARLVERPLFKIIIDKLYGNNESLLMTQLVKFWFFNTVK